MLVLVLILFLIIIGLIVAYYLGYLDEYIKKEPVPEPEPATPDTTTASEQSPTPAPVSEPVSEAAPTVSRKTFPNDIQGLSGRYTIESFNDAGNSWADTSPMKNHIVDVKGDLERVEDYVQGSTSVGLKIPIGIFGVDNADTMFYVARYNGPAKKRIFDGTSNDWYSGFHNGRTGVAHHKDWLTQASTAIHGPHEWVIATDAPNKFRSYGEDRVINKSVYNSTSQITVNMGPDYVNESSDWAIKEMIFYNRLLTLDEISKVESYLIGKYKSELSNEFTTGRGIANGVKFIEDPRPVPYGYGTPEFCRQQAVSLGYPMWGHRNEKHPNQNSRNKCFYYLAEAFNEFDDNDDDEIHTIGCVDPKRDIYSGCSDT